MNVDQLMQGLMWVALGAFVLAVFLLPSFIALLRRVEKLGFVIALNLVGAPTLVGWPAALVAALMLPSHQDTGLRAPEQIYKPGDPEPVEHMLLAARLRAQRLQPPQR